MQITPRQALLQCAHVFQQSLFPALESEIGSMSAQLRLLASVMQLVPLGPALIARRASTGRPPGWRHGVLGSGSGEFRAGNRRWCPGFGGGGGGYFGFGVFG